MSIALRVERLQRYLNDVHAAGIGVDGRVGSETLGALEKALDVEAWARPLTSRIGDTFDARTEANLATLDPRARPTLRKLVEKAMVVARAEGVTVKVISGHRTWEEQDRLFAQGRTAPGRIVTRARGGYSNHNFGIAIDFGVFRGRTYLDGSTHRADVREAERVHRLVAAAAAAAGLDTEWGGDWRDFPDFPHHEVATGLTLAEKRAAYLERATVLA
jgi:peptidoglycan L-alanyl-D-glutamate endopeptidase CwlK